MNIQNIRCHYKVNISNDKAANYEKIVFLNSKLKLITKRVCCLTGYGMHTYKNENSYLKIRITTFNRLTECIHG